MPRSAADRGVKLEPVRPEEPARLEGVVTRVYPEKGFLFIAVGSEDYFAHKTCLENCPITAVQVGDPVTFAPVNTAKGWRAEQVMVEGRG